MVGVFVSSLQFLLPDSRGFAVVPKAGMMVYEFWKELSLQVPPEELP